MADPLSPTDDIEQPEYWGSPADYILGMRQNAVHSAITSLDDDPEKAARAMELGEATGDHPSLIYGDLENYEQQHKAGLAAKLIMGNEHLRDYINQNPMAAKVSNDDYAQLDAVSAAVQKFASHVPDAESIAGAGVKGFKEGFGDEPVGHWIPDTNIISQAEWYAVGVLPELASRVFGGVVKGAGSAATEAYKQFGGGEGNAESLGREVSAATEAVLGGLTGHAHVGEPAEAAVGKAFEESQIRQATEAAKLAKPYIDAGQMPPVGLHLLIDQIHEAQAKLDISNLDEAYKEAQASATRERNPEIFASFIRQHGDQEIGISSDAVAKLYGDKIPRPDDGILGWVPDIDKQLAVARETGGDVEVPLADFLAKVEPEVYKEVKDDIRVRPGGITVEEGKTALAAPPVEEVPKEEFDIAKQTPAQLEQRALDQVKQGTFFHGTNKEFNEFVIGAQQDRPGGAVYFTPKLKTAQNYSTVERGGLSRVIEAELNPQSMKIVRSYDDIGTISREQAEELRSQGYDSIGYMNRQGNLEEVAMLDSSLIKIKDHAVDAIRKQAGLEPLLHRDLTGEIRDAAERLRGKQGAWYELPTGPQDTKVKYLLPSDAWSKSEQGIIDAIATYMKQVAPKLEQNLVAATRQVTFGGEKVMGVFQQYEKFKPVILYSLHDTKGRFRLPEDILNTVRHEAMHYLFREGFLSDGEWRALTDAAEDQGWIEKHQIDQRYPGESHSIKLEEAIAEEFGAWNLKPGSTHIAKDIFQKLRDTLLKIRDIVIKSLGFDPAVEDVFHKIEGGEVGAREPGKIRYGGTAQKEKPEGPFEKGAAAGLTEKQNQLYLKLIQEDAGRAKAKAEAEAVKRQTKEWKVNEATVRSEVQSEMERRPGLAADEFFRSGKLFGQETGAKPKLLSSALSADQRARLPRDYVSKDGLPPDQIASQFGYQTGERMISDLSMLDAARKESKFSPKEYLKNIENAEVERRMQEKFGASKEDLLREAKEHVASTTMIDMLHDNMARLWEEAGGQTPIKKQDVFNWVDDAIAKMDVGSISSNKNLAAAGRAGRQQEVVQRQGKKTSAIDAYKAAQQQTLNMIMAKRAMEVEKLKDKFDANAKRILSKSAAGLPNDYVQMLRQILSLGNRGIRGIEIAADNRKLMAFLTEKEGDHEIPIFAPDFVLEGRRTNVDDMSVREFREYAGLVQTLMNFGRNEGKILRAGNLEDLAELRSKMTDQMKENWKAKSIPYNKTKIQQFTGGLKTFAYRMTWMESIWNKLDLGDKYGLFNTTFAYQASDAANEFSALIRKYAEKIQGLGEYKINFNKQVENDIFKRRNGDLLNMTKENVIQVMRNIGNESNFAKLVHEKGWGVTREQVMGWLAKVSEKKDWDYVQAEGKIYEQMFREAEDMIVKEGAVAPEKLELGWRDEQGNRIPVQSPHGDTYEGWYHPIIYDREEEGTSKALMGADRDDEAPLTQTGYFRAATPKGWEQRRTGYGAPLYLKMDRSVSRMNAVLRDTAFRPFVNNAGKLFYDTTFREALKNSAGMHVVDMLDPYLKAVAGMKAPMSNAEAMTDRVTEIFRRNAISTLIWWNPHTIAKHTLSAGINSIAEVGAANFAREMGNLFLKGDLDPTGKQTNLQWIDDHSGEIRRRHQFWLETSGGAYESLMGKKGFREKSIEVGSAPIAALDLLSARPSWAAQYKTSMQELAEKFPGEDPESYQGIAFGAADRAVRRAHGSTAITTVPDIMRTNAWGRLSVSLYGFFNTMWQRQFETYWRTQYAKKLMTEGEYKAAVAQIPKLALLLTAGPVGVAIVEQMVTPYEGSEKDPLYIYIPKMMMLAGSGTIPWVRDLARAIIDHASPTVGLMDTGLTSIIKAFGDVDKGAHMLDAERGGKTIKDINEVMGLLTGRTNNFYGNVLKTFWDMSHHSPETPRNIGELARDIGTGHPRAKK